MKTTTNTVTAKQVMDAARAVPQAGNDSERVYVYDVLVHLIETVGVWMTGAELRAELVRLHRAGQIVMTRCDLVGAHDAAKLGEDGTCRIMSAEFNFICR
jgi:hypothetical protein